MARKKPEDRGMDVRVKGGRLVISIGIQVLAFSAVSRSADQGDGMKFNPKFLVKDPKTFAEDVAVELQDEEEDGTTDVHRILDAAMDKAIESGTAGAILADEDKKVAKRCEDWDPQKHDSHLVRPRPKGLARRMR